MIKNIQLNNFKCFESLNMELANLNVLSGINSMGKSTLVQALLLLRQSYNLGSISKGLHLNGELVNIGIGSDLLYRDSNLDEIRIDVTGEHQTFHWTYEYSPESDFIKLMNGSNNLGELETLNLFQPNFSYISADRIAPQRFYRKSYHQVVDKKQVGYKGELFADYLAEGGLSEKVANSKVLHSGAENSLLSLQAEAWLSEISPDIKLGIEENKQAGVVGVSYAIGGASYSFSPLNVGFGISYVIPVIVSILKATPGDLIILENPEAHLHPRGQRKMGELIAKACAGGVQIIVETHSDHLLNGFRLAVKKKKIDRSLIRLNYFYRHVLDDRVIHTKSSPAILDDGSLSDWPEGFFDEWDKAIEELF
ncbi:AAA family ATPase [Brevibacillus invocatus]|uniref:AAA family ATPase n=1 Tax=Brevibacillus invocatus TaxID=173959 RepID=UPI00203CB761|nr:DUF3696 domain-containing protein [Brevibacillus invocatus]MCM3078538.1 DUF3696 domain-containing protein [Brevibacillus invocatus]MCM3429211.1 DUF3696 domain-containing protein [Brevibacillus invocatus]